MPQVTDKGIQKRIMFARESSNADKVLVAFRASLVAQTVKNLPAMQETRVLSLDQEDPPEESMATHCSSLVWRIPWTEEPGRL